MSTVGNSLPPGITLAQPAGATGTGSSELNQASFLKLVTTQLQFQDPFDPVNNEAMLAQMAQISSLAGISEMNQSLKDIAGVFSAARLSEAANFIGRAVLAPGNQTMADGWGQYRGAFTLDDPAENVTVEYYNQAGELVHSQDLGARQPGQVEFGFQSVDVDGNPVDQGPLTVKVKGAGARDLSTWRPVTAVERDSVAGDAMLVTPFGNVFINDVRRVA
ncbi:MAG: flagellar hook capping FlgD N-terminal domain-containing protein [Blastomonas sp.]